MWKKKAKLFWTRNHVIAGGMTGEVMNLEDLVKAMPKGGGGFTLPARIPGKGQVATSPDKGIAVTIYGTKLVLRVASGGVKKNGAPTKGGQDAMENWLKANHKLLSHPNAHVGNWTDPVTKTTEINISLLFDEWEDAYVFGVKNDQISTYDIATGKITPTGGANEQAKEAKLTKRAGKAERRRNEKGR